MRTITQNENDLIELSLKYFLSKSVDAESFKNLFYDTFYTVVQRVQKERKKS